jgi:DNA-directed RNA polymerase specialized sigma24 family protein
MPPGTTTFLLRVSPPRPAAGRPLPSELASVDFGALRARVLLVASRIIRKADDAEEMTQRAIATLFNPDHAPWDGKKDLFLFVCDRLSNEWANERQRRRVRRNTTVDEHIEERGAPSSRRPERLVEAKEHQEKCLAALRDELAGDTEALGVLDQMALGVDEPADQARALGVPVEEIYNANRRIDRAGMAVAKKFRR